MKKSILFIALILAAFLSFGQSKKKQSKNELPVPRVWIDSIPSYTTTPDELLAHPTLFTDSVGCRVSGFSMSLEAPGHDFYGPLYSTTWEFTATHKEMIKKWHDYPNVTVYIEDIHLNCHEQDAVSNPIIYKFNVTKTGN